MPIPIENIYFLFCYAWGHFPTGSMADVGAEESPDLEDLLAKTLLHGTKHLLRLGLSRQYIESGEDTKTPRGRIDFSNTIKRSLRRSGQVHCIVDDLSADILPNRILKTTIGRLCRSPNVNRELRHELGLLRKQLEGVSEIRISAPLFRRVQLHSNSRFYRFLLHVCELVTLQLLPTESGAGFKFYDVLQDEVRMSSVFEAFVRNFYRHEQDRFRIGPRSISWDTDWLSEQAIAALPGMENDVRLDGTDESIIIDTKYYSDALREHHGRKVMRSDNLYQMYAYLKNLAPTLAPGHRLRGILLYPVGANEVDATVAIQGHEIRIVTLNLNQNWREIRNDLLGLVTHSALAKPILPTNTQIDMRL